MKATNNILIPLLLLFLFGCSASQLQVAPEGMIPKRKDLPKDVYGGYVSLTTQSQESINGEFLGIYQDSLAIWTNGIKLVHPDQINQAKIYIFDFNKYLGIYFLTIIPSLALLVHVPEYGGGPLVVAAVFSGINFIGLGAADLTERKKINYFDWNNERLEFLKYARFPNGVPSDISLNTLQGR